MKSAIAGILVFVLTLFIVFAPEADATKRKHINGRAPPWPLPATDAAVGGDGGCICLSENYDGGECDCGCAGSITAFTITSVGGDTTAPYTTGSCTYDILGTYTGDVLQLSWEGVEDVTGLIGCDTPAVSPYTCSVSVSSGAQTIRIWAAVGVGVECATVLQEQITVTCP